MTKINLFALSFALGVIVGGCNTEPKQAMVEETKTTSICSDSCQANSATADISCKLTNPELQARKETDIADHKKQVLEKKELQNGYALKFTGVDTVVDALAEFIKTERECQPAFYRFYLNKSVGSIA